MRPDDRGAEETTSYTVSGLVVGRGYDDGLSLTYQYDPAGRVVGDSMTSDRQRKLVADFLADPATGGSNN